MEDEEVTTVSTPVLEAVRVASTLCVLLLATELVAVGKHPQALSILFLSPLHLETNFKLKSTISGFSEYMEQKMEA